MDENKITEAVRKRQQHVKILRYLSLACFILFIIFLIIYIRTGGYNPFPMIISGLAALLFLSSTREFKQAPLPGSPEYEAIERQKQQKAEALAEKRYKKEHPFEVARDLVQNNKKTGPVAPAPPADITETDDSKKAEK